MIEILWWIALLPLERLFCRDRAVESFSFASFNVGVEGSEKRIAGPKCDVEKNGINEIER